MTIHAPVSHHFTPVFYLKSWAAADGRVTRYHRPYMDVVASPGAPKNTGNEDHLYTLHGVPQEQQAYLETAFFSPVDSRAAVVHRQLLTGKLNELTNEQRVDWARFMMSMQLRSPFSLGEVKRLADQNLRANLGMSDPEFDAIRKDGDPETIYDWTLKYQPLVIEEAHKRFLPDLIDHEELGQYLINMHWATVDVSEASHTLLTGDRPFIATHGWKELQAVLLFPLSPTALFVATNHPDRTLQVLRTKPSPHVGMVNNEIVRCAAAFVIGRDASHLAFVEKRLRQRDQEPIPGPVGKGRPGCPA